MPCAASPPSTFCQDHVVTSTLDQGKSMANAADVASQIVRPERSSAIQSALGTRTPEDVPFHVNTMSRLESACARPGSQPYGASKTRLSPSRSSDTMSRTQSLPKLSQAKT